jgi:hypothetical protein
VGDGVIAIGGPTEEPSAAAPDRAPRRRDAAVALAISAALVAIYSANGDVLPSNDAAPSGFAAVNLLQERRLAFTAASDPELFEWKLMRGHEVVANLGIWDLDAAIEGHTARQLWVAGVLVPNAPYYLAPTVRVDPATAQPLFVSTFGPGTPLAALPVLAAIRPFAGDLRTHPAALWFGAKAAASILVALSAAFVFLAARRWVSRAAAIVLALAYGLGTCAWSTSSQTLWQHAPDTFFVALGAYGLLRATESLRWSAVAGAAFAAATACRPTSAIFAVAAAVFLVRNRRALLAYLAAATPIALAIAGCNAYWFGSPLRFGQTVVGDDLALALTGVANQWQTPLWVGVPGLLVSPSRGLFVFSPFLLAAIPGAVIAWRRAEYAPLRPLAIAAFLVLLVAGKHYDWWGGWAYGYRHLVDLAPVLALLVAPVLGGILASRWRRVAFAGLTAWSIGVQAIGAFVYDTSGWNARTAYHVQLATGETLKIPQDDAARLVRERGGRIVGREPMEIAQPQWRHRLWSVRDNQIAFYLTRLRESRERRRRNSQDWISSWQPPTSEDAR